MSGNKYLVDDMKMKDVATETTNGTITRDIWLENYCLHKFAFLKSDVDVKRMQSSPSPPIVRKRSGMTPFTTTTYSDRETDVNDFQNISREVISMQQKMIYT